MRWWWWWWWTVPSLQRGSFESGRCFPKHHKERSCRSNASTLTSLTCWVADRSRQVDLESIFGADISFSTKHVISSDKMIQKGHIWFDYGYLVSLGHWTTGLSCQDSKMYDLSIFIRIPMHSRPRWLGTRSVFFLFLAWISRDVFLATNKSLLETWNRLKPISKKHLLQLHVTCKQLSGGALPGIRTFANNKHP